ncbi:MAG: CHAT domain-containing protein [Candidatus Polarisedimenticolia bacterium]
MGRAIRLGSIGILLATILGPLPVASPPWPAPPAADPVLDRLVRQERYAEAMEHAVAILRFHAERSGLMAEDTLAGLERVGRTACDAGDHATAEALLRAAIAAWREVAGPDDPRLSTCWLALARVARLKNLREAARQHHLEARRLLRGAGHAWEAILADLEQAEGNWIRKEDMNEALRVYRRSLVRHRRAAPGISFETADKLTWIGWMLGRMGRFEEAEPYLLQARDELRALGLAGHSLNGVIANAFGERLALAGRWDEAAPFFREVAAIFAASRDRHPPGFSRRVRPLDGFEGLTFVSLRQGRGEEAWTTLQRTRGAIHLDFARLGLWHERDEQGHRAAQSLARELLELRPLMASRPASGPPLWSRTTWRDVLRYLEVQGRLRSMQMRYLDAFPVPEASLPRVQAMLGPKSALLGFLEPELGSDAADDVSAPRREGWLYVVRRTGPIVWVPLPRMDGADAIRLRQGWSRTNRAAFWPLHVDPDPEVTADHRALGRRYLDAALPQLEGIEHLIVEGPVFPFDVMIGPDGRPVADMFDITYVPSAHVASMLNERRREAPRQPPRSILAISAAAPEHGIGTPDRLALASGEERALRRARKAYARSETPLDRLPPLPYAALEASLVAGKFQDALLLQGPRDVEGRLGAIARAGRLGRFDVLHFAGHSLSDGAPELAGLAVAREGNAGSRADDGILDVEEILLTWDLDAQLLTLSGCETARVSGAQRGEILGFTPALFAVGARNVLSSLWPVDDRATAHLMDRFYDNVMGRYTDERLGSRGGPMPLARALREARMYLRSMRDEAGRRPFEHPVYWAGFVLIGLPDGS